MSAKKRKLTDSTVMSDQKSWVAYEAECEFPIENLPFGVFRTDAKDNKPRCGVAIGDQVVDLQVLHDFSFFAQSTHLRECFDGERNLNAFMALGKPAWQECRAVLQNLLAADNTALQGNDEARLAGALRPMSDIQMQLPAQIGDYTDFYASRNHATNVGIMFRGVDNALQPNWVHLPVGYHGRASSVVLSGQDIIRPRGQTITADTPKGPPKYTACRLMDFELEVGCFIGGPANELGHPVAMEEASDRLFGIVLLNDWSARDIQKWEYVPLGPFGGKNLGTTISPWIVTFDALEQFKIPIPQDPKPLPYLLDSKKESDGVFTYDINLNVTLQSEKMTEKTSLARSNLKYLYWSFAQMVVQHSVTGCNMMPGDLIGSGTISGTSADAYGSMLELCWKGSKTIELGNGETRKFLADNDTVGLEGFAQGDGFRVGFGPCLGKILPALPDRYA
jgi:fumarylacetoacetase